MMFSVFCPTHDSNRLMTRTNALSFWNTEDGPMIRWKCSCGHEGTVGPGGSVADDVNPDVPAPAPLAQSA